MPEILRSADAFQLTPLPPLFHRREGVKLVEARYHGVIKGGVSCIFKDPEGVT